ncbi:MAG: hypothetical protein K2H85_01555, partial [Allobaculum sp.]|nr:hypothetical protein [Allobaculum sp.]
MKTKSRNLLTVILAALCAAAVALGVALLLPKTEKINAHAANVSNSVTTTLSYIDGYNLSGVHYEAIPRGFKLVEDGSSTAVSSGDGWFKIEVEVPAYTEYTVGYHIITNIRCAGMASGGTVNTYAYVQRYSDDTFTTPKGGKLAEVAFSTTAGGTDSGDKDSWVNSLIFSNDTGSPVPFYTYFSLHFQTTGKLLASKSRVEVYLDASTVISTDLTVPKTNDTSTVDYDGRAHTVNFEYAK